MPTIPRRRRSPEDVLAAAPVAGAKKVLLAAPRGYCAGVDRAVIAVEKALEESLGAAQIEDDSSGQAQRLSRPGSGGAADGDDDVPF